MIGFNWSMNLREAFLAFLAIGFYLNGCLILPKDIGIVNDER